MDGNVGITVGSTCVWCPLLTTELTHISDTAAETIINYFARSIPEKIDVSHREADYAAYINQNEEVILSVIEAR
jgi:hypothetical protein